VNERRGEAWGGQEEEGERGLDNERESEEKHNFDVRVC
jgi:hypothetical protein